MMLYFSAFAVSVSLAAAKGIGQDMYWRSYSYAIYSGDGSGD
jgi:hypothetical protein